MELKQWRKNKACGLPLQGSGAARENPGSRLKAGYYAVVRGIPDHPRERGRYSHGFQLTCWW